MEYLNWYNSGWQGGFIAKQGYYSAGARDGEEVHDAGRVGLLVRGQAGRGRHQGPVRQSDGEDRRDPRRRRFWERMGNVACWNTVMDEDRYISASWNEFVSA